MKTMRIPSSELVALVAQMNDYHSTMKEGTTRVEGFHPRLGEVRVTYAHGEDHGELIRLEAKCRAA